jgi:hypothetical protein
MTQFAGFIHAWQWLVNQFQQAGLKRAIAIGWLLVASLGLSGCIDYDVGVHFDHAHRGVMVQRLQLGERLQVIGGETVQQWVQTLEQRSRSLEGKIQRLPGQVLEVQIPFHNVKELEEKLNQFFSPIDPATLPSSQEPETLTIPAKLTLNHNNFIVVERDRLHYDVDLRPLGLLAGDGEVLVSSARLIQLEFQLETPWGANSVLADNYPHPEVWRKGKRLIWRLLPGEVNHLDAVFWLPSPLGIGSALIVGLVALGYYLTRPTTTTAIVPISSSKSDVWESQ